MIDEVYLICKDSYYIIKVLWGLFKQLKLQMTFVKLQDTEMGVVSDQDGATCGWLCVWLATAAKQEGGDERNETNLQARSNLKGAVAHMLKGRKFLSQVSFLQTTKREKRQHKQTNHNIFEWMMKAFMESTSQLLRNSLLSTKTPCTTQPLNSVYLRQLTLSKKVLCRALCRFFIAFRA